MITLAALLALKTEFIDFYWKEVNHMRELDQDQYRVRSRIE